MEDKNARNLILTIIIILLLVLIAVLAMPIYGPGPFRTGPACDLEFVHVKIIDGDATDTLSMLASGTTPGVDMEFFVNGQMVAENNVSPGDTISIQGDFGDAGDEVEVKIMTKFGDSRFRETVTIQSP